MIQLQNLTIGYGTRCLLHSVSTQFQRGTVTALIGRNGSGKSTLLRAIANMNTGYSGTIAIDGENIRGIRQDLLAKKLALVTTRRVRIANLRCSDVVALGRAPYTNWIGSMQDIDRQIVHKALESTGMTEYADRPIDSLSDGESQRIMIARALAQDTPIMLLDEPTSFLDMPNRYETAALLRDLAHKHDKCIVYSTHELDIALRMCDSVALIDTPALYNLPADKMASSGHIDRLFHHTMVN